MDGCLRGSGPSSEGGWRKVLCLAWSRRRFLLKAGGVGLLVGVMIAFSLPKEYESRVFTAPESTSLSLDEGAIDEAAGVLVGGSKIQDAIYPSLYPDIVRSPGFLLGLFDVPVSPSFCSPDSTLSLSDYLANHQRIPWWSAVSRAFWGCMSFLSGLVSEEDEAREVARLASDSFGGRGFRYVYRLSKREVAVAGAISGRIRLEVDKKRRTVAVVVRMQDPVVACVVADSVRSRLQAFVTDYRVRKEMDNLLQAEKLYDRARENYYHAQEEYACEADRNQNMVRKMNQRNLINLQIKKAQAYKEYADMALQVQAARTRVQKVRPVFAVIQPATVPLHPVSPSKMKWMAGGFLLFVVAGLGWIWLKAKGALSR